MRHTKTLLTLIIGMVMAVILSIGAALPANAATNSYPEPNAPGCTRGFLGLSYDCSIDDTYGGLVSLSTKYILSKNPTVRTQAIPAMIWTTLGGAVINSSKGALQSASNTNKNYIITAIDNTNDYNPSNGQISCVRNVLLDYIVKAGKVDKLTSNAFQFWSTASKIDKVLTVFGFVKDDGGIGDYLELVNTSKSTVSYVGKTVHVRDTVAALLANCPA